MIQAARPHRIRTTPDKIAFNILGYVLITFFAIMCVIPFYIVIVASFTAEDIILKEGYALNFRGISLDGYEMCLKNPMTVVRAYANTIGVTVIGTAISLLFVCMTGYVLQRRDFPWRNGFTMFFYITTLFSGGLTPYYLLCTRFLNFNNNYMALVLPLIFSVWNMIIAKNYMRTIPDEIVESAKIDGAGEFRIFLQLVFPLALPLVATLGLFTALAYWNDWYNCMLFISRQEMYTLQYFLQDLLASAQAIKLVIEKSGLDIPLPPQESMRMAMTIIVTGPIIFVYPFLQRYFVKGLTIGAVKG